MARPQDMQLHGGLKLVLWRLVGAEYLDQSYKPQLIDESQATQRPLAY